MRRSFTFCSIVVHAVVITAALIAQVVADGTLPTPHRPILFDNSQFMPVEIQQPRPRVAPPARTSEGAAVSPNAAPIVPPAGLTQETGREGEISSPPVDSVIGVVGEPPSEIPGPGIASVPPPPPPEPARPVRVGSGIRMPVKVVDVAPMYPTIARTAHVQGVVILEAMLDAAGRVDEVHVLRSIPLLDQAAVDAVRQWRYTPTQLNGRAVPVIMTVTVNFTLQDR
jgi:periplasmic protein TonB